MHSFTTLLLPLALASTLSAQIYYTASLTGAQEVPPTGSTATGKACLVLNGTSLTVTVNNTTFATTPNAGHIHREAVGLIGPVIIPFVKVNNNAWTASTTVTPAMIADLNAGLWYANLHTTQFSGGEIRGQIGPASAATTYGAGCMGTGSLVPAIGSKDFPCIGMPFSITLASARPSTNAGLLLGASNTSFNALSLPLSLSIISMPGCFLLTSDFGLGLAAPTDASGAGGLPIPIPLSLALVNLQLYAQWFPIDPAANLLGVSSSNGLSFKLQ
jgi:hypothetical protein